ncbi:MAG: hypothetical protein JWN46_949 [Acidimicrobiales bacterium]|nr:hypothetical protein [Acidimicrobiales bacterium]
MTTWTTPASIDDALVRIVAGATPVGGGAALYSAALAPLLGAVAVDLAGVLEAGIDGDTIGAKTTLEALAAASTVRRRWPALAEAAEATANPNVRRLATLGGTVAARLPTSDLPAALAAYGAQVVRLVPAAPDAADTSNWAGLASSGRPDLRPVAGVGGGGSRVDEVPLGRYLSEPSPPHIVVGVRLTTSGPGCYRRFALGHGPAPAIATVAAVRQADGAIGLWAGAVGPTSAPLFFRPDSLPEPDQLRSDRRASAAYRARVVAALAIDATAWLSEQQS